MLYLGAETGLFISTDRAKTWTRVRSNLPSVRIDEIVLHPRDNAMLLATHGRALWILDHLEPIQEYAAAQSAAGDAKLFTPPPTAMYRRPVRDRNYEFWGDQTFFGENPPLAAVISWFMKRQGSEVKLKITDAAGKRDSRDCRRDAGQQWQARDAVGVLGSARAAGDIAAREPVAADGRAAAVAVRAAAARWCGWRRCRCRRGSRWSADAEPIRRGLQSGWRRVWRLRGFRRRQQPGPVRASWRLQRCAHRRRQDDRHETAACARRSRGRADERRTQKDVRHGDGDAGAAKARHRGGECADAAECQSRRALEPGIR